MSKHKCYIHNASIHPEVKLETASRIVFLGAFLFFLVLEAQATSGSFFVPQTSAAPSPATSPGKQSPVPTPPRTAVRPKRLEPIFKTTYKKGNLEPRKHPGIVRSKKIVVDTSQITGHKNRKLRIPLFAGQDSSALKSVMAVRTGYDRFGGSFLWQGIIAGEPDSDVTLSVTQGVIEGSIVMQARKQYQIVYLGRGVHALQEIDQSKYPLESEPKRSPRGSSNKVGRLPFRSRWDWAAGMLAASNGLASMTGAAAPPSSVCTSDSPNRIDLLVAYTTQAKNTAGGSLAMRNKINIAIRNMNMAMKKSGINLKVRLVRRTELAGYVEAGEDGGPVADLQALQLTNTTSITAELEQLAAWREQYNADAIVVIVDSKCVDGCSAGATYYGEESNPISIVDLDSMNTRFTFSHEVAHQMCAGHECPDSHECSGYAHGYVSADESWGTIMATQGVRILRFSNPDRTYTPPGGSAEATGTDSDADGCWSDNRRMIGEMGPQIAQYRCGSS